jgi:hypothetical protein
MPGIPSSIGWGRQPFGQFPFGTADWAEAGFVQLIPEFYRIDDANPGGRQTFPLLLFLNSLKPSINYIEDTWRAFTKLWDADEIPLEQIHLLAANVGVTPSRDKPDVFQRLEILNNPQMILNKGTDLGYLIAGSFEGLTVTVTGLWAETCDPGAEFSEVGPDAWIASFDLLPADAIPLDSIYSERLAIWPTTLLPIANPDNIFFDVTALDVIPLDSHLRFQEGRCRTHSIRLFYEQPDDTEIEDYINVSNRVIRFIEKFRPQHVTIDRIRFDGPKASSTWVESIVTDASAAASWVMPVIQLGAASVSWTADITV